MLSSITAGKFLIRYKKLNGEDRRSVTDIPVMLTVVSTDTFCLIGE